MGKTEKGAIWLNEDLFSTYNYWQFWRNTDDRDVKRFLNFFTEIEPSDVVKLCEKEKNINKLKIILANEATKILHGKTAAKKAEKTAKETFEKGGFGTDLPEIKISSTEVEIGVNILDLLASKKILPSKSEGRRIIANNGLKINDVLINNEKKIIQIAEFNKKILKISLGKKRHYIIKII